MCLKESTERPEPTAQICSAAKKKLIKKNEPLMLSPVHKQTHLSVVLATSIISFLWLGEWGVFFCPWLCLFRNCGYFLNF